ncbi:MAG: hypothetical protein OEV19_02275, partial [Candidatus Bathyarchaeota archaeon]|nr:hypothetical protein [Candidatus Bathyarchaeota archaeon]
KPETFQVTCYYDSNPIGSPQTVTNLAPSASTTVIFVWDTTGVPPGTYYIYAVASTVPGEKDTDDNDCKSVETVTVLALQHLVVFSQTGLDGTATGIIVTVNGSGKIFGDLPFSLLVDNGTVVSYSYTSIVPSSVSGKRFRLNDVTGPTSPITVTSAITVTGNYVTQYYLTVTTNPTGLSPGPTPPTDWYDESTDVILTAQTVSGYTFNYWDVDGGSKGSGVNPITVHMDDPHTATAHYQISAPPPPVGGYALPITLDLETSNSSIPQIGLASALSATLTATIILVRRRKKTLRREH